MDLLGNLYRDSATMKALKEFMVQTLSNIAVEKTFNGESVSGIKDAKELVDTMFNELDRAYGTIINKVDINSR